MPRLIAVLLLAAALSACARPPAPNTYSRQQMGREATVEHGVILSLREVGISGTNSGVGASSGAVAGGLVGAAAESELTKAKATEFLIRKDNGDTVVLVQMNDDKLAEGERVMLIRMDTVRIVRDPKP